MKRRVRRILLQMISHLLLLAASILFLFPFYWMFSSSFKPTTELFSKNIQLLPIQPTLDNYIYAFKAVPLLRALLNSFIISIGYTSISMFLCSLGGFAFAKYRFPGRGWLFGFLLATMMVPYAVGIVPSFILMSWFRWVNTYWALIIPGAASAFNIFLMRQYIQSVPDDLIDAARIDGANDFATYYRIVLPLIQPALITVGLMSFFGSWNSFLWPLIVLRSNDMYTVLLAVNTMPAARFNTPWGAVMAGSTFAVLPLIVIFLFLQRYIVSGLMVGGVRG
jgi:ABC-type glycerol-3-phosphate transport system permease component